MNQKSFTLIEILVVIVIVGILSAFIIVSMAGVSDRARIAKGTAFSGSLRNSLLMNLVSEWKFDEGTGSIAYDYWGGKNGTIYGTTWKSKNDCVSGGCLYFNGSSDWVDLGDLGNPDSGTISLWFKKSSASPGQYLLDGRGIGNWWLLTHYSGYDITFYNIVTYNGISSNTWYNVVITTDYNQSRMYLDGKMVNTGTPLIPNFNSVRIATRYTNSGYFAGFIDDIHIYNASIPVSQIKEQYYAGLNNLLAGGETTKEEYQNRIGKLAINQP